jgi:hypothetical protein
MDRRDGRPDDFAARRPAAAGGTHSSGQRGVSAVAGVNGFDALRSGPLLHWLGRLSTRTAVLLLAGATVAGVLLTLIAGQEPGLLLGFFVIVGTLAAVGGIRRSAAYLLFPMPAIAFLVAAVLTGIVHDSRMTSSTAGLATSFLQWIAGIFVPMVTATVIAVLIGGVRWVLGSQLVTGTAAATGAGGAAGKARPSSARRSAAGDSWDAEDPHPDPRAKPGPGRGSQPPRRGPTGPTPRQTGPTARQASARPAGGQGTDRDPWGDPRLPADRSQPPARPRGAGPTPAPQGTGPTPAPQGTGPMPRGTGPTPRGTGPTPRGTGPAPAQPPRDRAPRSQPPGPSWTPASRPARQPRNPRQPPESWTEP